MTWWSLRPGPHAYEADGMTLHLDGSQIQQQTVATAAAALRLANLAPEDMVEMRIPDDWSGEPFIDIKRRVTDWKEPNGIGVPLRDVIRERRAMAWRTDPSTEVSAAALAYLGFVGSGCVGEPGDAT